MTACVGLTTTCYTHYMHFDLYTCSPNKSRATASRHHVRRTATRTGTCFSAHKRTYSHRDVAPPRKTSTHTNNHHFSLSSLFQLLPFIITQPEAGQHPVWLTFNTSYPQWTAIYRSARSYQLPSSSLLPRLFHFKAPIKAISSGTTFTWDKDFFFEVFMYKKNSKQHR